MVDTLDHDAERIIVVTHERISRFREFFPGVHMHLFGHRHGFKDTIYQGTRFVNVSALDLPFSVYPAGKLTPPLREMPNFNYGTYTVIEHRNRQGFKVRSVRLYADDRRYVRTDYCLVGAPFVHPPVQLPNGTANRAKR